MLKRFFAWVKKYETHLSACAMIAGFVIDNIFFNRIDLPRTQALFLGYLIITFVSITWLHYLESRPAIANRHPRIRATLPIVTQFMLGGTWSGFLIFYSRSATIGASWPFLLLLGLIFLGNEVFKKYHERLTFTAVLFFFALFSYAIFALPILTHTIGDGVFLMSGLLAVAVYALFIAAIYFLGPARFKEGRRYRIIGAVALYFIINLFYFTNILPPLPLASRALDVYHSVTHTAAGYVVTAEPEPWYTAYGFAPTEHVPAGDSLYAFSSVFAPTALTTTIEHRWEQYDAAQKKWVTMSEVRFPINGGRDGGYRGYSIYRNPMPGKWRVDVETVTGGLIGQLNFNVEAAASLPPLTTITIP